MSAIIKIKYFSKIILKSFIDNETAFDICISLFLFLELNS